MCVKCLEKRRISQLPTISTALPFLRSNVNIYFSAYCPKPDVISYNACCQAPASRPFAARRFELHRRRMGRVMLWEEVRRHRFVCRSKGQSFCWSTSLTLRVSLRPGYWRSHRILPGVSSSGRRESRPSCRPCPSCMALVHRQEAFTHSAALVRAHTGESEGLGNPYYLGEWEGGSRCRGRGYLCL